MLGNTAKFISSQISNGSVGSDLVQSIGTSLFAGIGNVLNAASSGAGPDNEGIEEDDKAEELTERADEADNKAGKGKVSIGFCQSTSITPTRDCSTPLQV